jgi:very-short-patch-repair endonuclease
LPASYKLSPAATERLEDHARNMRRQPTSSELVLWRAIRGGRLGVSFRRQVPIGPYIVDFAASRQRVIIEVDGGYHAQRASADRRRQRWLEKQGHMGHLRSSPDR